MQRNAVILLFWLGLVALGGRYYFSDVAKYVFFDPAAIGEVKIAYKWWLIGHFSAAACTLFLGPLQFMPFVRNRFRRFHRITGRFYIVGSLLSALAVYVLLVTTYSLPGATPSLGLLATVWIGVTVMAYLSIRKRNVKAHQQFMVRSYICGYAFVIIRLLDELNEMTGLFNFIEDETMRSTVYEWICWIYPLIIAEFFMTWWPQLKNRRA